MVAKLVWLYATNFVPYKMAENIVAIIHIYGAKAIFLIFSNHQDTEYKSRGMEISVAGLIFTHKYQRIHGTTISIFNKMRENILAIIRIYGARAILLIFYYNQDTEYESQEIDIGVAQPLFTNKNIPKTICDKAIHNIQ